MESKGKFRPDPDLRLMDPVRQVLQYQHYAYRTEQAYCDWIVRLMECVRLRVKDLDSGRGLMMILAAKGAKDRATLLPRLVYAELQTHLKKVKKLHEEDLANGGGGVYLPPALSRKYTGAAKDIRWQYAFPSKTLSVDPRSKVVVRHHVLESGLQKAGEGGRGPGEAFEARDLPHISSLCRTHLLENGVNIRVVQELMGHAAVKTTEIYTHVMQKDLRAVVSPLDHLEAGKLEAP
ncbi:MAG: tyrosine-type recombinase/integrase [Syntrophobacteraceae bacterium]